jgi:transposase-like protein
MAKETKYSIRNLRADFPTDEACLSFIFDTLHSRKCSCGGEYKQIKGRKQFQCGKCRFQIAPASNTIFHKSDTPLSSWFHAIWIFSNAKSGISAKELERQLGVTYKCAWRILSLIRKALKQSNDPLSGMVELDTGYFGGKGYGGEYNKNQKQVMAKKSVVMIAAERGGQIRAKVVENTTAKTMTGFLQETVAPKTTLLTDSATLYKANLGDYNIHSVNHSKKEFVRHYVHVNRIETFFAHLKRSIKGTYKVISKQHLQSYLDAFVFHYNNRGNDNLRFSALLGTLLRDAK